MNKHTSIQFVYTLLLIFAFALASSATSRAQTSSIYGELQKNPQFSTLVQLLTDAGLADRLDSNENLTLFAPNDDAFAAFAVADPAGHAALLADPAGALADRLLNHLLAGTYPSPKFKTRSYQSLSAGNSVFVCAIRLGRANRSVRVNGANVIASNYRVTNGFFHEIDAVIDPAYVVPPSVYEYISQNPDLATFTSLVDATGLKKLLNSKKHLETVFAPTEAALAPIAGDLALLNRGYLRKFVLAHIVRGESFGDDLVDGLLLQALDGSSLDVTAVVPPSPPVPEPAGDSVPEPVVPEPPTVLVAGAAIVTADGIAYNGVVHSIDAALMSQRIADRIAKERAKADARAARAARRAAARAARAAEREAARAAREARNAAARAARAAERARTQAG